MDNEDDILNVDFDPHDLENVDEDELLGRITPPSKPSRISVTSPVEKKNSDDDSDDEVREKSHDKFKTEQCSTTPKRIRSDRKDIPDTLDEVKIPQHNLHQERAATNRQSYNKDKRKYPANHKQNRKGKVLLNPHFKGTITTEPNVRLAWDLGQHHRLPEHLSKVTGMSAHLNKVAVIDPLMLQLPAHHSRPFNNKPMSLVAPPLLHMPPPSIAVLRPAVQPLMSIAGGIPYPPPAVSKSMPPPLIPSPNLNVSISRLPPPPVNLIRPPLVNPNLSRPPPANHSRPPPANVSRPPPANVNRPPPSLFATEVPHPNASRSSIKPLIDTSRPPPFQQMVSSPASLVKNDWLGATEDFLRRLQSNNTTNGSADSSNGVQQRVSRERQAAASIRRKYGIRSNDRVRSSASSVHDSQYSTVESYQLVETQKEPVDDDYLKKLEEQKRLREELNKRKEIRRQQEIAQKQRNKKSSIQPDSPQKADKIKTDVSQKRDRPQSKSAAVERDERIVKHPRRL